MTQPDKASINLPDDFYQPSQDVALEYSSIEHMSAEARVRRMDIVASVYLDELPRGKAGLYERVSKRLNVEEGEKRARNTIQDDWSNFQTFRLTGDQGLGFTREQLVNTPRSRMRAISHNRAWALSHKEEAVKILAEKAEEDILKYICESDPSLQKKKKKNDGFVSRELRLTTEDAAGLDEMLQAVENKMIDEGRALSDNPGTRRADLINYLLGEWLLTPQPIFMDDGRPQLDSDGYLMTLDNRAYLPEVDEAETNENDAA